MKISIYILCVYFISGCSPDSGSRHKKINSENSSEYDGVYNAYPIPQCMSSGSDYMLISHGKIQLYGRCHQILQEAGEIQNRLWNLWPNKEVLLTKTQDGIAMQVVGQDSFIEFPRLPMTEEEFRQLEVYSTNTTAEFLERWDEPPIPEGGWDSNWKIRRKWTDVYGQRKTSIARGDWFEPEATISNGTLHITIRYVLDESIGLVFNPDEFKGEIYLLTPDKSIMHYDFDPYIETDLVMIEPEQTFTYQLQLHDVSRVNPEISPKAGDMLFFEMKIDAPEHIIRSKWIPIK